MAIFKKGFYVPGHKPEKSLRAELDEKREERKKPRPVSKDARPLPYEKGSCFPNKKARDEANELWKRNK